MKTEILCVIDESSSMARMASKAIEGFNTFLLEQQELPGQARISLVKFASTVKPVYSGRPLMAAPMLDPASYSPRGNTAMYDGIGWTLDNEGQRIAEQLWADKVVVCILTDGEENSSREYRQDQIKSMIDHAQANGWVFVFLAANIDAKATAAGMGIKPEFVSQYAGTAEGTKAAYGVAGSAVRSIRSGI